MTPAKLVLLRLALLTLGRFTWGSKCIRFLLMNAVRRGGKMTYVAHADFLDLRRLHPQGVAEPLYASSDFSGDFSGALSGDFSGPTQTSVQKAK